LVCGFSIALALGDWNGQCKLGAKGKWRKEAAIERFDCNCCGKLRLIDGLKHPMAAKKTASG